MPPKKSSIGQKTRGAQNSKAWRAAKFASETPEEREARIAAARERYRELRETRLAIAAEKERKRILQKAKRKELVERRKLEMEEEQERNKQLDLVETEEERIKRFEKVATILAKERERELKAKEIKNAEIEEKRQKHLKSMQYKVTQLKLNILKKQRQKLMQEISDAHTNFMEAYTKFSRIGHFNVEEEEKRMQLIQNLKENQEELFGRSILDTEEEQKMLASSFNYCQLDSYESTNSLDDIKVKDEPVEEYEEGEIVTHKLEIESLPTQEDSKHLENGEMTNLDGTELTIDEKPDLEEVEIYDFLSAIESHLRLLPTKARRDIQSKVMDCIVTNYPINY